MNHDDQQTVAAVTAARCTEEMNPPRRTWFYKILQKDELLRELSSFEY